MEESQASAGPFLVPLSVVAPGSKPCGAATQASPKPGGGAARVQLGPPGGLASSEQMLCPHGSVAAHPSHWR